MPTTHVSPIRSMRTRLEYVTYGRGDELERRIASGDTRALAQACDLGDIETAYTIARQARLAHAARRNEGYEVRVSWSPEELNPDDPEHVERAMAFGNELMRELFPNCPVVITAHGDGVGRCLHLHCDVVNQDFETGRAIKGPSLNHKTIVAVSDRLADEWGMSKPTARPSRWAERRASLEARIEQAEESLNECLKRDNGAVYANYLRGTCRLAVGKYEEALQDFDAAIAAGEEPEGSHFSRGLCRKELGDTDGAMEDFEWVMLNGEDDELSQESYNQLQELLQL